MADIFVFKKEFLDLIPNDPSIDLERAPIDAIVNQKQLSLHNHKGFLAMHGHLSRLSATQRTLGTTTPYGNSGINCAARIVFTAIKKVLVTGHTGFKGGLAEHLAKNDGRRCDRLCA
jgi:NDP-sugar pyrophosphorylase family protein